MRLALILSFLALPAAAWEFSPLPICTVSHETPEVALNLTYDHKTGLYALDLTTPDPWPDAPVFAIRFEGPNGLIISTTRQRFSNDRRTITATDAGFGNVLNGLQFNVFASPTLGERTLRIPLRGAAPVIDDFRDCTKPVLS